MGRGGEEKEDGDEDEKKEEVERKIRSRKRRWRERGGANGKGGDGFPKTHTTLEMAEIEEGDVGKNSCHKQNPRW